MSDSPSTKADQEPSLDSKTRLGWAETAVAGMAPQRLGLIHSEPVEPMAKFATSVLTRVPWQSASV